MGKLFAKEHYRWVVLISCILIYCTSTLVRWNYTSITKYLSADLLIGKPELGLLGSAFFYAYAVAQTPVGTMADVFGGRRVIPLGTGLMGLFLIGFAVSTTFTETLIWRMFMGVSAAAGWVPISAVLSKWFSSKERGFALELITGIGGGLGEVVSFILIPLIALVVANASFLQGFASWRGSTALMGIVVVVIAISSYYMIKSSPTDMGLPVVDGAGGKKKVNYGSHIKTVLKDPALWLLSMVWSGYIISSRLVLGWIAVFAAEFYIHEQGMTKEKAMVVGGTLATTFVIGRCVSAPITGKLSDYMLTKYKMPRSVVLVAGLVLLGVTFFWIAAVVPSVTTLAVFAFMTGALINIYALVNVAAAEIWSTETAGFSTGIINTVGQFAGAAALSVSGYMAVMFAVKGGGYYTEYYGIWYLGIITCALAVLSGFYVVYREYRAWADPDEKTAKAPEGEPSAQRL